MVGTAELEIVFFWWKPFTIEAYINNQIERLYVKFSAVIKEFVRTVTDKNVFIHGVGCSPKSWNSPLIFVKKAVKINANFKINNILVLLFQKMKKEFQISEFHLQDGAPQ